MALKGFLGIIRAPFLLLAVILGFLGACIAWYESRIYGTPFDLGDAFLAGFGLLVAHIAVNVWNEWFDYRSRLDEKTRKTPFSGGSGALPGGLLTAKAAFWTGVISILIIIPIGVYYTLSAGWLLLPLLIVALACIVLYTPLILKMGYPEWAPGIGLGLMPVMGAYFIQTGEYTMSVLIASVPSAILVHNLLLLNEIPDVEADVTVGRRTLPIVIGKKNAARVFAALLIVMYLWIIAFVITGDLPVWSLLALLSLPLAVRTIKGAFRFASMPEFVPAQAGNVFTVLLTQLLLGIGFILAGIF